MNVRNQLSRKRNLTLYRHSNTIGMIVLSIILIITSTVVSDKLSSVSNAATSTAVREKCYTSYEIQPGDTLWSIANAHMSIEFVSVDSYVKEVMYANHMLEDSIQAGCFLMIPYYAD